MVYVPHFEERSNPIMVVYCLLARFQAAGKDLAQ